MKKAHLAFLSVLLFSPLFVFAQTETIKSTLTVGAVGEEVRVLQTFLANNPPLYPEAYITGYFGKLTQTAVKRFQALKNIDPIGIVGPRTRAAINAELLVAASATGEANRSSNAQSNSQGEANRSPNAQPATPASPAQSATTPATPSPNANPTNPNFPSGTTPPTATTTPPTATTTPPVATTTPPTVETPGATTTPPTATTTPSTKFVKGDRVVVTENLNVRTAPGLTQNILGTQSVGALGIVLSWYEIDGYDWWYVDYDTGFDGWSVENYLEKAASSTPAPPLPLVLQAYGGPAPRVSVGPLTAPVYVQNLTCRFCTHNSPPTTALVYYTGWYPNDPGSSETGPRYGEQILPIPSIAQWSTYSTVWQGQALQSGHYYFVIVVDPQNLLGTQRIHRVEFYIE